MTAAADRHLLFGLLALQTGIIDQGQLVAAFQAWTLDKMRSLADILVARGELNAVQRSLLAGLADPHLQKHGDVEKSLAAVPANRSTRASLAELGEPDIEATLARVARSKNGPAADAEDDDPERTSSIAVGSATSDGQRFRILRPHAQGGLGAVFVALDGELHREVALKQILEKHADDPVSRQRFIAEAEITGGLEHHGVVSVYGLGADSFGRPYYATRLIKGDSLKEAIEHFHGEPGRVSAGSGSHGEPGRVSAGSQSHGEPGRVSAGSRSTTRSRKTRGANASPLAFRQLLRRFTDVCNAIDYAHSRGVIHRDIKPANIIVGKYGETLEVSEDLLMKEKQFEGLRSKLLKGAAEFYGRLEGLLKSQTDRESRAALGKAYDELGELTGKIGDQPAALADHRKALAVRRALAAEPGAEAGTKLDVARSLNSAGVWQSNGWCKTNPRSRRIVATWPGACGVAAWPGCAWTSSPAPRPTAAAPWSSGTGCSRARVRTGSGRPAVMPHWRPWPGARARPSRPATLLPRPRRRWRC